MAFPELLKGNWQDEVRALCGGAHATDVPDTLLALDSYGPSSESEIKKVLPDWDALNDDSDKAADLNRAAIRRVAAKICDYCKIKFRKQSERIGGEYEYTMAKIDWPQRKLELLAEYYDFLADLDPEAVSSLSYIDKIERVPPVYEDLELE